VGRQLYAQSFNEQTYEPQCVSVNLMWPRYRNTAVGQPPDNGEKISKITNASNGYKQITMIVEELNRFLTGWGNYFKLGHPGQSFNKLNGHVQRRIYRFLQRRSQRGFKKPDKDKSWYRYTQELGIRQITKRAFQVNA
jgi:hypothetical protein